MDYLLPLLLIAGGILAVSSLIVAKKPDAKAMIDRLVPYQAFIGVGLLGLGLWNLIRAFEIFKFVSLIPVLVIVTLAMIVSAVLLGFMFGMPQIAKWMPGEGAAEQKGMELSTKLAPFQVLFGLIGIASSLLFLLFRSGILKPM